MALKIAKEIDGRNNKLNIKYFRLYIYAAGGRSDFERSLDVTKFIMEKIPIYKKPESNALAVMESSKDDTFKILDYYRCPLLADTFVMLKIGMEENPSVKLVVENDFLATYRDMESKAKVEAELYTKELGLMRTIHNLQANKKVPILKKYTFPKLELKAHQKIMLTAAVLIRRTAFFVQMGLGKTAAALHAIGYRIQNSGLKKAIIVVPNTLRYKWAEGAKNEVDKHTNLKAMVLDGDKQTRLAKINKFLNDDTQILVTSYSFWSGKSKTIEHEQDNGDVLLSKMNMNADEYALLKNTKIDMFVLDESHYVKNPNSNVTKNLTNYCKHLTYGVLLSGSPTPNNLYDIFSQYGLLDNKIYGNNYFQFTKKWFKLDANTGKLEINSDLKNTFISKLKSKAIVYKSEDCIEFPTEVFVNIDIKMSDAYMKALTEVSEADMERLKTCTSNIQLPNSIVKLLTVCSGYMYISTEDNPKDVIRFKNNPKLETLKELIESIVLEQGKKLVIWYNFKYDVVLIKELLDELKLKYLIVESSLKDKTRIDYVNQFESDPSIQILVGSPKLIAEGIDIYSTNYAVYFNMDFWFEKIEQSQARLRRLESKKLYDRVFYYRIIMTGTIEDYVLSSMTRKLTYKEMIYGFKEFIKQKIVKAVG